jgi:type IV secretory pathway component VirB8
VLAVLVITLLKMIPLERPEVFFLVTPTRATNVIIEPLDTNATNKVATENYFKGFIREYIIARNTLNTNTYISKNNWTKVVKPWSSKKVFSDFEKTSLYNEYALGDTAPNIDCSVNFSNSAKDNAIVRTGDSGDNTYLVNFIWVCKNIGGQTTQKNYKILVRIQSDLDKKVSGTIDNLKILSANPLGIQVTQYTVLDGKDDPLNSDITSW